MRISALIFILTALLGLATHAESHGAASGYLSNVEAERNERYYEVYLFVPQSSKETSLRDMIFNPLTKEFKIKYREAFGDMDLTSITSRAKEMGGTSANPLILQQENDKRRAFAEYMSKRLLEYHFDNYMKTQPQMRPVMEVKEKIQNVKVEVTKEVRLNIQYNFAGNMADFILDNPYCESKLSLEMEPRSFGPTAPRETRMWVSRNLTSSLRANSNLALTDGLAYGDLTKAFPRYLLATTLGLSTPFKQGGTSVRETRWIFAFTQAF